MNGSEIRSFSFVSVIELVPLIDRKSTARNGLSFLVSGYFIIQWNRGSLVALLPRKCDPQWLDLV